MNGLEILAPAGNLECAKAAIHAGTDAIYLGYSAFSARQNADNFDEQALRSIVEYAHILGVKVYVAMNTIVKDSELESFFQTLVTVWNTGIDAVIMQDILLGGAVHKHYPQIVLHASTQAGVCSMEGAKFAKDNGFERVILARETPLSQIKEIAGYMQTEVFVQGALCTSFSGQCYFSSFVGGNSGNRGRCKQPCRKRYAYDREGFDALSYALSPADLCVGEEIAKLIEAGVVSFKIEGRMRRAEYVAAAVSYYKLLLKNEGVKTERELTQALSALKRTYNRGNYTKGLAFGQDKRFLSTELQGHMGEKVGVVKVVGGKYVVESSFVPDNNDAFKILREGKEVGGATLAGKQGKNFTLFSKTRLKNGDSVFITTDSALSKRLLSLTKRKTLALRLYFVEGEYPIMQCDGVQTVGQERLQSATGRPLTVDELKTCFSKIDGLPVDIVFEEVCVEGDIFIPKSALNALRRTFFDTLKQKSTNSACITFDNFFANTQKLHGKNQKTAVLSTAFEGVHTDIAIYKPQDYTSPLPASFVEGDFERYVYFSAFHTPEDIAALDGFLQSGKVDGVYAENYAGLEYAKSRGVRAFAGTGLHISNALSLERLLAMDVVAYYALSKELNEQETLALASEKAFALRAGDISLMQLCYCPFKKTCKTCDKRERYMLTDENGRKFPVVRSVRGDGSCRFEIYNCAALIATPLAGVGSLHDCTVKSASKVLAVSGDIQKQKSLFGSYTSGHATRGVL